MPLHLKKERRSYFAFKKCYSVFVFNTPNCLSPHFGPELSPETKIAGAGLCAKVLQGFLEDEAAVLTEADSSPWVEVLILAINVGNETSRCCLLGLPPQGRVFKIIINIK